VSGRLPRILVDLDGVLADFEAAFAAQWTARFPDRPLPDPADRTSSHLIDSLPPGWREDARALVTRPGFFRDLPLVPGAAEGFAALSETYPDVWICSTPSRSWWPCVPEKYAWVDARLGPPWTERVILTRDKSLILADVLIDDQPELAAHQSAAWRLVLFDAPYNRHVTGVPRLTWATWRAVLRRVLAER